MKQTVITLFILQLIFQANAQWNLIHQDSIHFMYDDLYFLNKDTGFVGGGIDHYNGLLLRTCDGGITWEDKTSILANVSDITFINDSVGFAGGQDGGIAKTTDMGETWTWLQDNIGNMDYNALTFLNDSLGIMKEYCGGIYKTVDGGSYWSFLFDVSPYVEFFYYDIKVHPFYFLTDSIWYITGNGIHKTTDQGDTWSSNIDSINHYHSVHMFDENEGIAVGNFGIIIHTYDDWSTWTTDSICPENLRDIDFINDSVGYITGGGIGVNSGNWGVNGVLLYTTNRGNTWNKMNISQTRLNGFQFIDSVAYIVGIYGEIFKNENYNSILNLRSINSNSNVQIWPNPTISYINIDFEGEIKPTVLIYNLIGQKVLERKNFTNNAISLSHMKSGTYIVKVITGSEVYSKKIILMKNVP